MSSALVMFYAGAIGLCLGTLYGAWVEARRWRAKAKGQPRMESGGVLYHVIEHGDCAKLADVLDWPEHRLVLPPAEPQPDAPTDIALLPDYWDERRRRQGKPDLSRCAAELRIALRAQGGEP